jgi:hypothetical protein
VAPEVAVMFQVFVNDGSVEGSLAIQVFSPSHIPVVAAIVCPLNPTDTDWPAGTNPHTVAVIECWRIWMCARLVVVVVVVVVVHGGGPKQMRTLRTLVRVVRAARQWPNLPHQSYQYAATVEVRRWSRWTAHLLGGRSNLL